MSDHLAERFVEALHALENEKNVDAIADLFADGCEVGNTTLTETLHGRDGARKFWSQYRATFDEVHSDFKSMLFADDMAALEWVTNGSARDGGEISYEGVSMLEMDDDKITRFFAYFNPGKLGSQLSDDHARS